MYYWINFCLLLSLMIGLARGAIWAALCSIASLCWIIVGLHYDAGMISLGAVVAAFCLIPVIAYGYQRMKVVAAEEADTYYVSAQKMHEMIVRQDKDIQEKLHFWEHQIHEVVGLYEITKGVSESMTLEEIFTRLEALLTKTFCLSRAYLVIFREHDPMMEIQQVASIIGDEGDQTLSEWEKNIVHTSFAERRQVTCLPDDETFRRVYGIPEDRQGIMAVPIISASAVVGVFVGEGLVKDEFEKFAVVAGQFGLGMRKARLYEEMQSLAITDGLTGVYVRRHFVERFTEEMERARRHTTPLALLMVDADHFKKYNDEYGHLVGDVLLKEIAGILRENVREIDLIGRFGGEEFIVLLLDADRKETLIAAERIRQAVEARHFKAYDEKLRLTVSVGVGLFPDDKATVEELLEAADTALYDAKHAGRNQVKFFGDRPF